MNRQPKAFTLLEAIAAATIVAILAAVAISRLGPKAGADFAADADAVRLAFDLRQTQRRAIATGDSHYVQFASSGGAIASYSIHRRLAGGSVQQVEATRAFDAGETVAASSTVAEFTFEGAALAGYAFVFTGPNRQTQVTVAAATGAVSVVEL